MMCAAAPKPYRPDAPRRGGAGQPPRAKADQAGAQQRRGVRVVVAAGQGEAEALVGDRVFGEAAVAVVAGEDRVVAKVLAVHGAVAAVAAGLAEPGDADALADGEVLGLRARAPPRCPPPRAPARRRRGAAGSSPSMMCRSVRQTPQASTRTSTSWPCGCGTGLRAACSCRPRGATVIAFMKGGSMAPMVRTRGHAGVPFAAWLTSRKTCRPRQCHMKPWRLPSLHAAAHEPRRDGPSDQAGPGAAGQRRLPVVGGAGLSPTG